MLLLPQCLLQWDPAVLLEKAKSKSMGYGVVFYPNKYVTEII